MVTMKFSHDLLARVYGPDHDMPRLLEFIRAELVGCADSVAAQILKAGAGKASEFADNPLTDNPLGVQKHGSTEIL